MADTLDKLLEPGERVVYRARAARRPLYFLYFLVILCAMAGLELIVVMLPIWELSIDLSTRLFFVVQAMIGLGCSFWLATFIRRNALLVTDRRVIHRSGRWPRAVTAVSLEKISNVRRRARNGLEIREVNGETIVAEVFERGEELARAVAHAAGLAAPDFPGPKERVLQGLADALVGCLALVMILLYSAIDSIRTEPFTVPQSIVLLIGLIAIWVVMTCLGFMVVVAVARFFMSADEMRDGLCRDAEATPLDRAAMALMLRFAGVLYGRPLRCRDCAEGTEVRHGR